MSQAGTINISGGVIPPSVPESFVTDNGTATPSGNSLNVFGGPGISTSGSGNTVTITAFQPNKTINISDDFLCTLSAPGYLNWQATTSIEIDGTSTHPGLVQFQPIVTQAQGLILGSANNAAPFGNPIVFGGGSYTINWVFNLITLSNGGSRYVANVGFLDDLLTPVTAINDGVYFSYSDNVNGGNWVLNCTKGTVTTSFNTSTAASVGFHNYGITVNAAGTLATFTIDGVSVGTVATNIPTTAGQTSGPGIVITNPAATFPLWVVDLFYMSYTLTTAR